MSLLRSPLLHFLALGVAIFFANAIFSAHQRAEDHASFRIEISPERLEALEREFATQAGRRPTSADRERILDDEIADEIFLAEARARDLHERDGGVQTRMIQKMLFLDGEAEIEDAPALLARARALELDRGDIVVRRILIQKMKLFGSALTESEMPDQKAIEARYTSTREALREPDRIDLIHLFLSIDERGAQAFRDALAIRKTLLGSDAPPAEAIALGDPFPLGHRLTNRSERDLVRSFGAGFGPAALALPAGRWSAPIESAYGLHLLFVEKRTAGQIPPIASVEDQLRRTLEHERQESKLKDFRKALRARYQVVVPPMNPAPQETATSHNAPPLPTAAALQKPEESR